MRHFELNILEIFNKFMRLILSDLLTIFYHNNNFTVIILLNEIVKISFVPYFEFK